MAASTLITNIGEWLVDQALSRPDMVEMFDEVCHRLYGVGIPLTRARLTWPTLHPLFQAETVVWQLNEETTFEQFLHRQENSDAWRNSPMHFMFERNISVLRRHLDGPDELMDFPILEELREMGLTDYLVIATEFDGNQKMSTSRQSGIIVTWATDREGGFSDSDIAALEKIQRRFAVACKAAVQTRIAENIVTTYLGKNAGKQVLDGAIQRGDGSETQAVVWYSDLRNSTALADTMPPDDYIAMLNVYFECTASAAIDHGGEVLDFIGDAVLAIFPYDCEDSLHVAAKAAGQALNQSQEMINTVNKERKKKDLPPIRFGVGLNTGKVMFGNIGVKDRLSFSVIGPTVNEVARIESLTKRVTARALATKDIASIDPDLWEPIGLHQLTGVSQKVELFSLKNIEEQTAMPIEQRDVGGDTRMVN